MSILSSSLSRLLNQIPFGILVVASFFFFSACTNINSSNRNPSNELLQSNPSTDSTAGSFRLDSLAADPVSPGTVIDLIGSQNQFDSFCSLGVCFCEFTFLQAGVGTQTISTAVTYQESNLIRCQNIVPTGTSDFSVRVIVTPAPAVVNGVSTGAPTYFSNSLSGNFSNGALQGSTSFLDLTNATNFVPVQRFQCRKREFIANPMNTTMIDPFQAQNPAVVYPFNYYTTNIAQSLLTEQQVADQSWECTLNATQDHSLQWWANPNVFSTAVCTSSFCAGDGSLIYPQNALTSGKLSVNNPLANGKRRSSFHLASRSYGVFQYPVTAAISPKDYVSANYAVIGYGAKPIAGSNGTSSCPNIALPPNATWVKLWNFRATDITSAKKVLGSQSVSASVIACDTTHQKNAGTDVTKMIFPSCEIPDPNNNIFGVPLDDPLVTAKTSLATRVAALNAGNGSASTSACYNFGTGNLVANIPWHSGSGVGAAVNNGLESWIPSPYKFSRAPPPEITLAIVAGFPWNLYNNAISVPAVWNWSEITDINGGNTVINQFLTNVLFGSPTTGPVFVTVPRPDGKTYTLPAGTPIDYTNQLVTDVISRDNYTDQLFVVTDPGISDTDMRNNSSSVQQYIPRTFRSLSDCPGPASCDPIATGKPAITWGVRVQEVGKEGGPDVYPLCVLQFYD